MRFSFTLIYNRSQTVILKKEYFLSASIFVWHEKLGNYLFLCGSFNLLWPGEKVHSQGKYAEKFVHHFEYSRNSLIHCKKRLAIFPDEDGKNVNLFLQCNLSPLSAEFQKGRQINC
jgi:hypothetical protein